MSDRGRSLLSLLNEKAKNMPMTPPPPDSLAEGMTRAHGALMDVLDVIDAHRHDLSYLSAGRALVERADRVRASWQPSEQAPAAKGSAA